MTSLPLADLAGWRPYTFADEPGPTAELLPAWPTLHPHYPLLHGFSRLGHVFISDDARQHFGVVHPLQGANRDYEVGSLAEFRRQLTDHAGFQAMIFPPALVRPIVERLGPVGPEEVYFPVPYPMLGGSGAPETYSTGDVWVFLDIVGQLWQRA